MKVLVTGGAGFIGSHVVDALVEDGCEVVVVDSLLPAAHENKPDYLDDRVDYRFIDLRDVEALAEAVAGVDAVSHQAAMVGLGRSFQDVTAYVDNNDLGTAALLRVLDSVGFTGRLAVASSMVVYGEGRYECPMHGTVSPPPRRIVELEAGIFELSCPECDSSLEPLAVTEDARTDPRNVYAATKLHQEHLCSAFGRETGASVVALRYHNVYGSRMPRDTPYAGVASIFRSALQVGEPPLVYEDGAQIRDFIHVRDVARSNVAALQEDGPTGAFNIATGSPTPILEVARILTDSFDGDIEPVVTGAFRIGDVRHVFASPARARLELGWHAETNPAAGLKAFAREALR